MIGMIINQHFCGVHGIFLSKGDTGQVEMLNCSRQFQNIIIMIIKTCGSNWRIMSELTVVFVTSGSGTTGGSVVV
jgi:hypothetical protein